MPTNLESKASQPELQGTDITATGSSTPVGLRGDPQTGVLPPDTAASLPAATASSLNSWCYMSPDEQWQGPFTLEQLQAWRHVLPMDMWLCRAALQSGALHQGLQLISPSIGLPRSRTYLCRERLMTPNLAVSQSSLCWHGRKALPPIQVSFQSPVSV
jgi:hypothetical protein